MKNVPFIIKSTGEAGFPYLIEPLECSTCSGKTFKYSFGSALLTIILGIIIFTAAFGINSLAQEVFDRAKSEEKILQSKLNYVFLVVFGGIVIGTLLLYFIDGQR